MGISFGQIELHEDSVIQQMMTKYAELNKAQPYISGWRIQVMASTDRRKIEAAYSEFNAQYPNIPCEWKHERPFYKLRAGAYPTKLKALAASKDIKQHYHSAIPAMDKRIRTKELINN